MSLLLPILLSGFPGQPAPQAKPLDAAVFERLIEKTNDLAAFAAVYRVHTPDTDDGRLTISYRAPEDLKCELPGSFVVCVRDGVVVMLSSPKGGQTLYATVPVAEQGQERWSRLAASVQGEFKDRAKDWRTTFACGPQVKARILPPGTGDDAKKKKTFEFETNYVCPRTAILGWLETFQRWSGDWSEDADHLLFQVAGGARLSLSKKTGFIESVTKEGSESAYNITLDSLDLEPKLERSAFEFPARPADAVDASGELSAQAQQIATFLGRKEFLGWISKQVSTHGLEWNADARLHVRHVFEALHGDGLALENGPWLARTKKWIEDLGPHFREAYGRVAAEGEEARGQFEERVQETRAKLNTSFERMLEDRTSRVAVRDTAVADEALGSSLLEVEKQAIESAFEGSIRGPLLEAFDDQITRAKGGG